ncbi:MULTISPECIES: glucosamine 6-phosphate synthetase [Escherichia]|uniref:glutamine--fructose-6-phosphate transaminase (isomerizing) n=1 Tax=Escherichia albertii TaxID=208962 RepID=A0A1Y9TI12_ESCAL|nr:MULTISPECIES: glucosamine 6-phosphate synthetase [Escherichia]ARO72663.1 glucosamine 6-phosphate synthetase [Escherichia albertii]ARO72682.1 glucosamine 6-phosphate synthetase [Escherichia albertii]ARO72862.1 glucosamine 6-phosphate synthetase [Escherichia albertii]ARO72893.1 glucosamine 6-phosphate synthetase [Escherichia albertii]ARO72912.1 glucosamine 6-phosphate synthetase [Escherichia albertii]
MCGIFGIISSNPIKVSELKLLAEHARQRGRDSSGLIVNNQNGYDIYRADYDIKKLLARVKISEYNLALGHSRLITNGLTDNQPVVRDEVCVIHNGIIVNHELLWSELGLERRLEIDTEIIAAITEKHILETGNLSGLANKVLDLCQGVVATAIISPSLGKMILFSNNGSLYVGEKKDIFYFSSEKYPLTMLSCDNIKQVFNDEVLVDIPISKNINITDYALRKTNLIPKFIKVNSEAKLLEYPCPVLRRCTRCILPETMPYISFDDHGVCNYCRNYKTRNNPKPKEELFELVKPYRRNGKLDCIVPFSGGRDSCYALHLIVKELQMKPVTYTYDWGMVTDLGRRNISRMCAELGVENIIVADDISKKRRNIALNLKAWLKSPHLGMISILTAGDKHFFRHVESVKKQTGINLNLWGVNPLEVTHFKSGFLGIPPDFAEERVYSHGWQKQLTYQKLRFKAMLQSLGYFNRSLWDTLSGEYYRSFTEKKDYYHIFDYWRWDEKLIDDTLINEYKWETAVDTNTTWRIGDGTAAFYNYIYYVVAGFTEHDTFRSNQIREGQITRELALKLVKDENQPRYENIRWYLDALGMDFSEVIKVINNIPRLYEGFHE